MAESKPGYFAVLPADVRYDDRLRPNAKLIYAEITALQGKDGYCFATNETIGKWYGLSGKTVSALVSQLQDAGYIDVLVVRDPKNNAVIERRIRSMQAIAKPPEPAPKNGDTPPPKNGDTPPLKNEAYTNTSNLPEPPKAPQRGRQRRDAKKEPDWKPERFSGFWKFYPRGEAKQAAIRAWDKLKPDDATIAKMGAALTRQMHTEDWQRGIGIPYASTWLNGRRWEDEEKQAQAAPKQPALPEGMRLL